MIDWYVYMLIKFYGSQSKTMYRVAELSVTISFSWNSVLSALEDSSALFPEHRFWFHGYEEFEADCDFKGDLYDFVAHIKLVSGQTPSERDAEELASTRRILLHVQTHDGPVMKLYLWDRAATAFFEKYKAHGNTPSVIMVTTVNPKRFGDWTQTWMLLAVLMLILSPRLRVIIGDLFSYIKQEGAKVAWFECDATVDDVVQGTPWYYIGCGVCHTKATKGPITLMCKKYGKAEITGVAQYLTINVRFLCSLVMLGFS